MPAMAIVTASPKDVFALRSKGPVTLIDVRTPAEFREIHAEGATSMPLDRLDPSAFAPGAPVYLICKSDERSRMAAAKVPDAVVVEGGTVAWEKSGLPVVRGKKTWALERQVRLVAGLLVLIGVALGWFVHPYLFGLAAFVGAGLTFSGLTNFCGMGLLLARMPWNR